MLCRHTVLAAAGFLVVFALTQTGHAQVVEGCRLVDYSPPPVAELSAGPQSAAMAGITSVGQHRSSHVLFSDPSALLSLRRSPQGALGYFDWIGDVRLVTTSGAVTPSNGRRGTFGVGAVYATYSTAYPASEPCRGETVTSAGLTAGWAYPVTDRLRWGAALKYLQQQDPPEELGYGLDLDASLTFETGIRSLLVTLGGSNLVGGFNSLLELGPYYRAGGTEVNMPATFYGSAGINLLNLIGAPPFTSHELEVGTKIEVRERRRRSLHVGGEYSWNRTIMLRAGYVFGETSSRTPRTPFSTSISSSGVQHAGLGLRHRFGVLRLGLDYAFAYREQYDHDHRVSASAQF